VFIHSFYFLSLLCREMHIYVKKIKQFQSFHGPQFMCQGASLDHQVGSTAGAKDKLFLNQQDSLMEALFPQKLRVSL